MVDKIVQRISLEGAEEVQAKLKKTGEIGAKALESTQKTISDSNSGLAKYGDVFAGLNGKTEESRGQIEGIKKVLETIKPAAEKAGLEIGNIGEFGKIGRGGVIALAGAFATTLVAAIEKAGDTARDQAQRLGAFTGSAQKGIETYKELQKTAQELKVPTAGLAAPFEQITRTNQRFGNQLSGGQQIDALKSLFVGAEADRVDEEQATPAIKAFLAGLQDTGRLTPELAKGFSDVLPTLMKRLLQDLQNRLPNATVYSAPETLKSLGNIFPQLEEDQRATQATFGSSIGQSLTHLKAEASKLGDALNGAQIVSTTIEGAAKFVGATAEGIKALKEARHEFDFKDDLKPNPAAVGATSRYRSPGDVPLSAEELGTPGIIAQPIDKIQGGEGDQTVASSLDKTAKSAEGLSSALDKTADSAEGAQHTFDRDKALHLETVLGAAGAKLTTEQARIEYEHKPEEASIQIGRDELAVQTAAIAKQSAQIGVQEAAKGKELADLAPEQAESAQRSADSRYSKALKNLRDLEGFDTSAIQQRTPIQEALNELKDADTARKVADVNRKYAYLEPQKAELAQKKAETDIRSADYLEQDSTLKLAKDKEGQPLSTEVAALRYQQAQLDEEKKIQELGAEEVKLLGEILSTLQQRDKSSSEKSESREPSEQSGRSSGRQQRGDVDGTAPSSRAASAGRDLLGSDGVVNIPQGASQEEIARSLAKQRAGRSAGAPGSSGSISPPIPAESISEPVPNLTKEGFRADLDHSIDDLKADWKSQRELNAQLHKQGTDASPQARTPAGVSQVNPPPVHGHYDKDFQFKPDVPTYNAPGAGASIPATNDYQFSGRKNPAGPYQEGISAPVTFPEHNRRQLDSLPSEYPTGVPVPQPRPPEADQQKQGALPDASQLNGLSAAFAGFIQSVTEELSKGKAQTATGTDAQPPVQNAASQQSPSTDAGEALDQSAGQVDDSLKGLASAVAEAANSIRSASAGGSDAGQGTTYAATGGLITGPGSTTSDSIPAMLSNKEFVVNAASAEKHIGLLHAINSGRNFLHFAVGGPVGLMGDVGLPSISGATVSSSAAGGVGQHFGTVDLRTDHGDFRVSTEHDTMRHLSSAAQKAKRYSTGTKPGWYGGSK